MLKGKQFTTMRHWLIQLSNLIILNTMMWTPDSFAPRLVFNKTANSHMENSAFFPSFYNNPILQLIMTLAYHFNSGATA